MAVSKISGVRLTGISGAVPEKIQEILSSNENFKTEDVEKIIKSTGVHRRHIASENICTSDLCFAAATHLLAKTECPPASIDTLIFVSQTSDYLFPATSCSLHARLNLDKSCAAFDINLGCSGYIYGLWVASNLIMSGSVKKVLLLVGDTITRVVSPLDRSTALLFGDAGTATLIESDENTPSMTFILGTDGAGKDNLIAPASGFRQPHTISTSKRTERENGNIRSDEDMFMDGAEIFSFTLCEVPPLIKSLFSESGWQMEMVDAFIMHQANQFILEYLAKRMKLPKDKVVFAMKDFGNTSSASIPMAMVTSMDESLKANELRLVLAGFGVGLSWGAVALTTDCLVIPELFLVS